MESLDGLWKRRPWRIKLAGRGPYPETLLHITGNESDYVIKEMKGIIQSGQYTEVFGNRMISIIRSSGPYKNNTRLVLHSYEDDSLADIADSIHSATSWLNP